MTELQSHAVTYDLDDLVELSKLVPRGPVQVLRLTAAGIAVLFALTIVGEVWSLTGIIDWWAITVFLFAGVAVLFISNRKVRARFWLRVIRQSPLHAAHSYAVTPAGLRISSPKGVFNVRWTSFPEVKRTVDRLFVFMSPRQAYVIPRRAFDSDEQFEAFVSAAEKEWEQSQLL